MSESKLFIYESENNKVIAKIINYNKSHNVLIENNSIEVLFDQTEIINYLKQVIKELETKNLITGVQSNHKFN